MPQVALFYLGVEKGYDQSVRVPDDILRCVGFIGEVEHQDSRGVSGELCATGFFVAIPCQSPELREMRCCYFITAKHVATDLEGRQAYFLVNAKGGGVTGITGVIGEHWFLHPTDPTADVAAIQIKFSEEADMSGGWPHLNSEKTPLGAPSLRVCFLQGWGLSLLPFLISIFEFQFSD